MSKFEFISVFVSIVLAFALSELLMGWGRLIRIRHRVRNFGLYLGWTVWLLVLITFHYLGFWEYNEVDIHTTGGMLLLLSAPIIAVLLAFLVTPDLTAEGTLDLEKHYFGVRGWFFPMAVLFLIMSYIADSLLPDFSSTWLSRSVIVAPLALSIIWLAFSTNRTLHYGVLVFNLLLMFYGSLNRAML